MTTEEDIAKNLVAIKALLAAYMASHDPSQVKRMYEALEAQERGASTQAAQEAATGARFLLRDTSRNLGTFP